MRFLLRAIPNDTDRQRFLSSAKGIAKNLGARVTHPRWTSYGALEIDVFTPSVQDFELFSAAIEPLAKLEFTKNLDEAPPFKEKEQTIREAVGYFNSERYWECHEVLESVWRASEGQERLLVQAIILLCAAQVHEQRGETDVALNIYRRALPQLAWEKERYYEIDIPHLRRDVELGLKRGVVAPLRI